MKCKNCGTELRDGDIFCSKCSTKVDKVIERMEVKEGRASGKGCLIVIALLIGVAIIISMINNQIKMNTLKTNIETFCSKELFKDVKYYQKHTLDGVKHKNLRITFSEEFNKLDIKEKDNILSNLMDKYHEKRSSIMFDTKLYDIKNAISEFPEIYVYCNGNNYEMSCSKFFKDKDGKTYLPGEINPKVAMVSSTEESNSNNNVNSNSDIPSNAIHLYYKGDSILCGTTEDNFSELINCIVNKDEYGFKQMLIQRKAFRVPSNTRAIILDRGWGFKAKVRIVEGTHKNEIAWVASEDVGK